MRINLEKYQVVEWVSTTTQGIENSIVASAATWNGCNTQYQKHLMRYSIANIPHNPVLTKCYKDGLEFKPD